MFKKIAFAVVGLSLLVSPAIASAQTATVSDICSSRPTIECLQAEIQQLMQILTQLIARRHSTAGPLTASPASGPSPLTVTFTARGAFSTYTIDFGDGESISGTVSDADCNTVGNCGGNHIYSIPGTYTARLLNGTPGTCDEVHCIDTNATVIGSATIRVGDRDANSSGFSASPTSGAAPLTVTFSSMTGAYMMGASTIDYGDGTSEFANPCSSPLDYCISPGINRHTYASPGTYTAKLIDDSSGTYGFASVRSSLIVTVTGSSTDPARVTYLSNSGSSVTGSYSNLPAGSKIIVMNQTTGQAVPGLSRSVSGSGTVSFTNIPADTFYLKAQSAAGAYIGQTVSFHSDGSAPANVRLTVSPTSGTAPLTVSFNAVEETTSGASYSIYYGDGATDIMGKVSGGGECISPNSCLSSASHTYTSAGTYTVKLLSTPAFTLNCITCAQQQPIVVATTTIIVTGSGTNTASLTATPTSSAAPLTVTFNTNRSNIPDGSSYSINFGDGQSGGITNTELSFFSGAHASHTYSQSGTYTAQLVETPHCMIVGCTPDPAEVVARVIVTVTGGTVTSCPVYQQPLCPAGQSLQIGTPTTDAKGCQVPHNTCVTDPSQQVTPTCTYMNSSVVYIQGGADACRTWCASMQSQSPAPPSAATARSCVYMNSSGVSQSVAFSSSVSVNLANALTALEGALSRLATLFGL